MVKAPRPLVTAADVAAYRSRPDGAAASQRASQRNAAAVRQLLRVARRRAQWARKRREEEDASRRREELFARLARLRGQEEEPRAEAVSSRRVPGKRRRRAAGEGIAGTGAVDVLAEEDTHDVSSVSSSSSSSSSSSAEPPPTPLQDNPFAPRHPPHHNEKRQRAASSSSSSSEAASHDSLLESRVPKPVVPAPGDFALLSVLPTHRPADVVEQRGLLPVCGMEQEIMEAILAHPVVFLTGETGSGKTTQVPQMLVEGGFGCTRRARHAGMIAVVQPRRVAAISTATRVAYELGTALGERGGNRDGVDGNALRGCVGYQVRHDASTVSEDQTRVKFMTDGILLREAREDLLLRKYSVVLLDEAHERGVNSDLLLGLLSRIVPLRETMFQRGEIASPLKLLVMSATRSVEDLARSPVLFPPPRPCPPVLRVESRQHPVTAHFARTTELDNYLDATLRTVTRVHKKLPPGGVLVFLTGQNEIEWMCRKLREVDDRLPVPPPESTSTSLAVLGGEDADDDGEGEEEEEEEDPPPTSTPTPTPTGASHAARTAVDEDQDVNFSDVSSTTSSSSSHRGTTSRTATQDPAAALGLHVVPLFSRLAKAQQDRAFLPPPPGKRLVVVATNVAETSITIPGIRYVVDCGREKRRDFDQASGTSTFRVDWVSKSSADQRMGRAGRTMPGHCYRVYSAAVYMHQMRDVNEPEISRVSIDDLVLYMKTMGIERVAEFPFPTAPSQAALRSSERRLTHLGALGPAGGGGVVVGRATDLGRAMSRIPLSCRLSKMLVVASRDALLKPLLPHLSCIAASASLSSPFFFSTQQQQEEEEEEEGDDDDVASKPARQSFATIHKAFRGSGKSDFLSLLRAAGGLEFALTKSPTSRFCHEMRLDEKVMLEARTLTEQVYRVVTGGAPFPGIKKPLTPQLEGLVCQAVASGFIDHVARKLEPLAARARAKSLGLPFPPRHARDWPYETSDPEFRGECVFLSSRSFLYPETDASQLPAFVVYQHVTGTNRMEGVTEIDADWLVHVAGGTNLVQWGHPLEEPEPSFDVNEGVVKCMYRPVFGSRAWSLPLTRMPVGMGDAGNDLVKYQWFARFLVEGKVPGFLPPARGSLSDPPGAGFLAAPAQITRAAHFPNVMTLVGALAQAKVSSSHALRGKVQEDPSFLVSEMKLWIRGFRGWRVQ